MTELGTAGARLPLFSRVAGAEPDRAAAEDEGALVRRAASDPDAFAELYRRTHPHVARYVRRRVGDPALAEDLVSETYVTALENLDRYRWRGLPFAAWLYRLATSRIHRWLRREGRRGTRALEHEPLAPAAEEGGGPEEARRVARAALDALPRRFQDVLVLHSLEGLPVAEVARIVGCREGTVKSRLARGREALREQLERMGWPDA